jgi:general secretion pathway protein G
MQNVLPMTLPLRMRRPFAERRDEAAFTLVELLVVLAILSLLVGIAVPQLFRYFSQAKEDAARIQMQTIASGLDLFLLDVGRYPTQQEGLQALVESPPAADRWAGPYVREPTILTDPWGRPYVYRKPGQQKGIAFDLFTRGPDGDATGPPAVSSQPASAAAPPVQSQFNQPKSGSLRDNGAKSRD